jgi:uncharacterized protein YndB with AHSA1/START domain
MAKSEFVVDKDKLEVRLSRVFNAKPERLWQAHTTAEDIVKWWEDTTVDKLDVKVGGEWRFVSRGQDGKEYAFRGEFKEIDEPKKIVRTFEFEGMPGHVMTETLLLEALPDGKTKQVTVSKFLNENDMNGMVSMGMEEGAEAGLERLAKVVEG